jgi:hypothetical protein
MITILTLRKTPVIVMAACLLRHFLKRCCGFGRTIPSSKRLDGRRPYPLAMVPGRSPPGLIGEPGRAARDVGLIHRWLYRRRYGEPGNAHDVCHNVARAPKET